MKGFQIKTCNISILIKSLSLYIIISLQKQLLQFTIRVGKGLGIYV